MRFFLPYLVPVVLVFASTTLLTIDTNAHEPEPKYHSGQQFSMMPGAILCQTRRGQDTYKAIYAILEANIGAFVRLAELQISSDRAMSRAVLGGRETLIQEVNHRYSSNCRASTSKDRRQTRFRYLREIDRVRAGNGLMLRVHEAVPISERDKKTGEDNKPRSWREYKYAQSHVLFFDAAYIEEDNPPNITSSPLVVQSVQAQLYEKGDYPTFRMGTGTLAAVADSKWGAKTQEAFSKHFWTGNEDGRDRVTAYAVYDLLYYDYTSPRDWVGTWAAGNRFGREPVKGKTRTEAAESAMRQCGNRKHCKAWIVQKPSALVAARCRGRKGRGVYATSGSRSGIHDRFWIYVEKELGASPSCGKVVMIE